MYEAKSHFEISHMPSKLETRFLGFLGFRKIHLVKKKKKIKSIGSAAEAEILRSEIKFILNTRVTTVCIPCSIIIALIHACKGIHQILILAYLHAHHDTLSAAMLGSGVPRVPLSHYPLQSQHVQDSVFKYTLHPTLWAKRVFVKLLYSKIRNQDCTGTDLKLGIMYVS